MPVNKNKHIEYSQDDINKLSKEMKRSELNIKIPEYNKFRFIKESDITISEMEKYVQDKTFTILKNIYSSKKDDKIRENLVNLHFYLNNFKIT
tara:strand:+ start:1372 stop:1650 length:279 start_codon:yes stop_codon:yes gene_type:complete